LWITILLLFFNPLFKRVYCYSERLDKENKIVGFQYGTWDPLGAEMHIIRGVLHPKFFRISGKVLKRWIDDVRKLAKELGMRRIYWMTCRSKAFLRKLPNDLKIMKAEVLEVQNV